MLKTQTITISYDDNVEKLLENQGLSLAKAYELILEQANVQGKLPIDSSLSHKTSDEDILRKLKEAEKDIKAGNVYTKEEVFSELRRHIDELRS